MSTKKTTTKTVTPKSNAKSGTPSAAIAKIKPVKKAKPSNDQPRKMSALDAAAKVLGEATEPMATKEMIDAMSANGYWTSPGGQTPQATLYAAIAREIKLKGAESRFAKAERGRFELQGSKKAATPKAKAE